MPFLAGYLCFLPLIIYSCGVILFFWGLFDQKREYLVYVGLILVIIAIIATLFTASNLISILFDMPIEQLWE